MHSAAPAPPIGRCRIDMLIVLSAWPSARSRGAHTRSRFACWLEFQKKSVGVVWGQKRCLERSATEQQFLQRCLHVVC